MTPPPPDPTVVAVRRLLACALLVCAACPKDEGTTPVPPARPPVIDDPILTPDSPFLELRRLLALDVEDKHRALKLAPLVQSICKSEEKRRELLKHTKRSVELGGAEVRVHVEDVLEHVATSCWRHSPQVAYALLEQADAQFADTYRFELVLARLLAADGKLDQAQKLAAAVRERGSVHAIALEANIRADIAREQGPGYRKGMFDEALDLVRAEPQAAWAIIDLTAVLSTRAHLLLEVAVWEDGQARDDAFAEAVEIYQRMGVAPFPEVPRSRSLDMLCFLSMRLGKKDDPFEPCARAVKEDQNLGALHITGGADVQGIDMSRMSHLLEAKKIVEGLSADQIVVVVARGNETELVTWTLPGAELLRRVVEKKAMIVTLDRSRDARGSALFQRMLGLAGVQPKVSVRAGSDPFATTCVASVTSGRKAPEGCPLEAEQLEALRALVKKKKDPAAPPVGILIGRDLDAEIEDFRVYQMPSLLLSFREAMLEKKPQMHLKSVSDVWIFK